MTRREALGAGRPGAAGRGRLRRLEPRPAAAAAHRRAGTPRSARSGKPIEKQAACIYNWSQYDDPSTYKSFTAENHGPTIKETYYSSNDELLAKLQAGGSGYDIVVPSQNAVGELMRAGAR